MQVLDSKAVFSSRPRLSAGPVALRPGETELPAFDLRDTLSGITVREISFSDFLAALKQAGKLRR